MAEVPQLVDFDACPPMSVTEYEQTVKRVNVGYDLLFTLTECFLRALHQPDLHLLAVGASGGSLSRYARSNAGKGRIPAFTCLMLHQFAQLMLRP